MLRLSTRRGGWVDLITLGQASAPKRHIATASAIHRGLRRSKGAPEPSYGSRRGPRPTDANEGSGYRGGNLSRGTERADRGDRTERSRPSARGDFSQAGRRDYFEDTRAKPRQESDRGERGDRPERPRDRTRGNDDQKSARAPFGEPRAKSRRDFDRTDRNDRVRVGNHRGTSKRNTDSGPDWDVSDSSGFDRDDRQRKLYDRSRTPYNAGAQDWGPPKRSFARDRGFQEDHAEPEAEDGRPVKPARGGYKAPISIPYTTAASEFLYGTSVVEAALRSTRRQLYKLYAMKKGGSTDRAASSHRAKLINLAAKRGISVELLEDQTTLLDKMSQGRPHNGIALEASPLKRPTAKCLMPLDGQDADIFRFEGGPQSEEDGKLHGSDNTLVLQTKQRRHPFVLMLDGVQDTGNMGGIIRTAHFLGVDAIILSATCAPMNAVVLKASAGAAEQLPLLYVSDTSGFIGRSSGHGWKFFASVAPPKKEAKISPRGSGHLSTHTMKSPLLDAPCVLMIGGEGTGLKPDLVQKADRTVSIPSWRYGTSSVDSLNVSVATGVLANAFLSLPPQSARPSKTSTSSEEEDKQGENTPEPDRSLW